MFRHSLRSRGFTLIELLVVISIIGMLSSIVLVSLQNARTKAVNSRILQGVGQLKTQLELERTNTGYATLLGSVLGGTVYAGLTNDAKKFVDDILKQQGLTIPTGYKVTGTNCTSPSNNTSYGMVIVTDTTNCTPATEYAIYAALKPVGTAGYVCKDSKGGQAITTSSGMPTTPTVTCPGGTVTPPSGASGSGPILASYTTENDASGPFYRVTMANYIPDQCDTVEIIEPLGNYDVYEYPAYYIARELPYLSTPGVFSIGINCYDSVNEVWVYERVDLGA